MTKNKLILNKMLLLFVVIFAVAAFLRLYRLEAFMTFLGDQGRDAIIIKRIVTLEHLTAIGAPSSIGQVFLGPFYYYLVAPFLLLFNFNPVGLAFGVAFFSLVGFAGVYLILKKEVNYITAILFSILLAFSSVNIELSRFSWNPNLLPVFAFFTLYFWYKTLRSDKWYFPVLFGVFFSCAFQLHHLALLLGLPIAISFVLFLINKKNQFNKSLLVRIIYAAIGFFVIYSPLLFFDIRNRFLNTVNFLNTFTKSSIINDPILNKSIQDRLLDTTTALFDHVFRIQLPPMMALISFIVFTVGMIFLYKKTEHEFIRLNILNTVLFTFVFGILNSARHAHYYGAVYYSILVVLAYILYLAFKNKILRFTIIPLFLITYIAFNAQFYHFFYNQANYQARDAEKIAASIIPRIKKTPYQIAPLPIAVTDGHIRYFLEIKGNRPLNYDSAEEGEELYVMCFYGENCKIIGNPQWHIAAFSSPKIDTMWKLELVTIYKLVHEK